MNMVSINLLYAIVYNYDHVYNYDYVYNYDINSIAYIIRI